jgi:DNA modification methylase
MWPLAKIKPYAKNARSHPPEQIKKLAADMRRQGVTMPILVDEAGEIIAGHGRLLAAQENGFAQYPVAIARGWSDEEKRAARIADNRRGDESFWNPELLRIELQELKLAGLSLPDLGFSAAELSKFLDSNPGQGDKDHVPAPPAKTAVRIGDLWHLGRHRIICGDSTDEATVRALLEGRKPKLMVTDPPYGVEYDPDWRMRAGVNKRGNNVADGVVKNDDRFDWTEAWKLFPGDVAYVWHGALHTVAVAQSLVASDFQIRSQIIWAKSSLVIGRGDYHWKHEPCWYAVRKGKTGHWAGDRKQSTVWDIATTHPTNGNSDDMRTKHSTQKPIECMKRPIENNSQPGDLVYEPFSGSGTTIIACEMTGRIGLAIELNPPYVEIAIRRWENFTGEKALLDGASGMTLERIEKTRGQSNVKVGAKSGAGKSVPRKGPSGAGPKRDLRKARAGGLPKPRRGADSESPAADAAGSAA